MHVWDFLELVRDTALAASYAAWKALVIGRTKFSSTLLSCRFPKIVLWMLDRPSSNISNYTCPATVHHIIQHSRCHKAHFCGSIFHLFNLNSHACLSTTTSRTIAAMDINEYHVLSYHLLLVVFLPATKQSKFHNRFPVTTRSLFPANHAT